MMHILFPALHEILDRLGALTTAIILVGRAEFADDVLQLADHEEQVATRRFLSGASAAKVGIKL